MNFLWNPGATLQKHKRGAAEGKGGEVYSFPAQPDRLPVKTPRLLIHRNLSTGFAGNETIAPAKTKCREEALVRLTASLHFVLRLATVKTSSDAHLPP